MQPDTLLPDGLIESKGEIKMKKIILLFLSGLFIVITSACESNEYGFNHSDAAEKTIVKTHSMRVVYDNKNELVNNATAIVKGEVIASEVEVDRRGFPVTDYTIKLLEVFKGNPPEEFQVRTEEGVNNEMIHISDDGAVTFQLGEKVILFLTDEKGKRRDKHDFDYFVVGSMQGKLMEVNGKFKNDDFIFDTEHFAQEIQQIEEQNKAAGLQPPKATVDVL